MRASFALFVLTLILPDRAGAQLRAPADGGRTPSLGQPSLRHWAAGAALGGSLQAGVTEATTELRLATTRDLGNPVMGIGALQFEAFGRTRAGEFDGGVRARLMVPFLRLGVGVNQDLREPRRQWFLSMVHPARRGGVFGDGSQLRLDIAPGRNLSVSLGLEKPIQRRPPPGKSRPFLDHVPLSVAPLPRALVPEASKVTEALAEARERGAWIGRYTVPWLDHPSGNRPKSEAAVLAHLASLKRGLTATDASGVARPRLMEDEVRRFHAAMERAFAGALESSAPGIDPSASASLAGQVAARARVMLLDEVLLPYDRLLAQTKIEDTTNGFARRASGIFLRWLHLESGVPRESVEGLLGVFTALLDLVEENRARIAADWRDSRFVWLPLQWALLPEEHDTQSELDAIVERAARERFTEGNAVSWVINEQAQYQFSRMIHAARDYHVLWIHDFRGTDEQKDPDETAYRLVLNSYLKAMTARVRAYDSTGTFPAYLIFIDQWFYAWRAAPLWMDLLEDPMKHVVRLPRDRKGWSDSLRIAQDSLRAAVASSRLLQAQRARYGERWLRELIKVHVNVTNTSDLSFQSRRLIGPVAVADNMLRDHRKISFYDISEEDPYRGEAMFTGTGVGENYANESWEDRSLLVRGPAALHLKAAARLLLKEQGVDSTGIPWVLRPLPFAADYDARVSAEGERTRSSRRALGLHNLTGYGRKDVNVAKAVLYTLMPPGSVIKLPDSLWNASFWGAAVAGCALRGGRVLVIAPSAANSPVPAFGSVEHAYELMWRLMTLSRELAPELAERGGLVRVGVFASPLAVTNIPGKLEAVQRTFAEQEWLRELFGFPPSVYEGLAELVRIYEPLRVAPDTTLEDEGVPRLHLKANLFASREAWSLMTRPEWMDMTHEFVAQRIAQAQEHQRAVQGAGPYPDAMLDMGDRPVRAWYAALSQVDRERVVFYTMVGSQNHNGRSMVTDGEVAMVVSGWPAVIPTLDLISLVGLSKWPTEIAELNELHPPMSAIKTWLAHWLRLVF